MPELQSSGIINKQLKCPGYLMLTQTAGRTVLFS